MNWTVQGTRSLIEENTTIHDSGHHKTLTSMIVLRLNDTENTIEDKILVSCRMFFEDLNFTAKEYSHTSTKVPGYVFVWSTRMPRELHWRFLEIVNVEMRNIFKIIIGLHSVLSRYLDDLIYCEIYVAYSVLKGGLCTTCF